MILDLLRGIRLLRHRDLVRRLGDIWSAEREIQEIRRRNPGCVISSEARFPGWRGGELRLAATSRIEFGNVVAIGDELNGYGRFSVGAGTWIGPYNNFRLASDASITIGEGCLISQFCSVVAANHSLGRNRRMIDVPSVSERRGVSIGDDVWVGAGAILLPGIAIADGAVIAAGSIVTHSVGAYEIWAGNPARAIGERRE